MDEKTNMEDVKEPLKMEELLIDDKSEQNIKDYDCDMDDLFYVIECSDDMIDDIITDQLEGYYPDTKKETIKTEGNGMKRLQIEGKTTKKKENKKKEDGIGSKSCDYCGDILPSLYNLANHMSSYHTEFLEEFKNRYKTIRCELCPFICYTKRRLQKHMQKNHPKKACDQCDKTFYHDKDLKEHKAKHALTNSSSISSQSVQLYTKQCTWI